MSSLRKQPNAPVNLQGESRHGFFFGVECKHQKQLRASAECLYRCSFFNHGVIFCSVHFKEWLSIPYMLETSKFFFTVMWIMCFRWASLWLTHICGLLLRQFQFLLSVLQGLRVLVKLILCSLQLLLQSQQLILQLKEIRKKVREDTAMVSIGFL